MRPAAELPSGTSDRLEELLKRAKGGSEVKRIQCVYYRAKYKYTSKQIAELTGYNERTVRRHQAAYLKEGESSLKPKARGGRRRANMSQEEETAFLEPFTDRASAGEILEIGESHQAYADQLGRSVHRSVVYVLLHRHGWRKVSPRPVHPKHDPQAAETFKKSSPP